jgi:hypothetical protein
MRQCAAGAFRARIALSQLLCAKTGGNRDFLDLGDALHERHRAHERGSDQQGADASTRPSRTGAEPTADQTAQTKSRDRAGPRDSGDRGGQPGPAALLRL